MRLLGRSLLWVFLALLFAESSAQAAVFPEAVSILNAFVSRHPLLLIEGTQWGCDPFQLVSKAIKKREALGKHRLNPHWKTSSGLVVRTSYYAGENISYSSERLKDLLNSLDQSLVMFFKFTSPSSTQSTELVSWPAAIPDFIASLRTLTPADQGDLFRAALRLAPLLWNETGAPQDVKKGLMDLEKLRDSLPARLNLLFDDMFMRQQLPLIRSEFAPASSLGQELQSHLNTFIQKTIRAALTPLPSSSNTPSGMRKLSLEEVPASISLFRGWIGGDCSAQNVPFFSLLNRSRTFFIRKSFDLTQPPDGYLLMTEGEDAHGILHPYVITINGARLSYQDANAALTVIQRLTQSEGVWVPDTLANRNVTNSDKVKEVFELAQTSLEAQLPSWWMKAADGDDQKYYHQDSLTSAELWKSSLPLLSYEEKTEAENHYDFSSHEDFSVSLLHKTFLAARLDVDKRTSRELVTFLGVGREEIDLAEDLLKGSFGLDGFKRGEQILALSIEDLRYFSIESQANIMIEKFAESPEVFETAEDNEWKKASRRIFNLIRNRRPSPDNLSLQKRLPGIPDELWRREWNSREPSIHIEDVANLFLFLAKRPNFFSNSEILAVKTQLLSQFAQQNKSFYRILPDPHLRYRFLSVYDEVRTFFGEALQSAFDRDDQKILSKVKKIRTDLDEVSSSSLFYDLRRGIPRTAPLASKDLKNCRRYLESSDFEKSPRDTYLIARWLYNHRNHPDLELRKKVLELLESPFIKRAHIFSRDEIRQINEAIDPPEAPSFAQRCARFLSFLLGTSEER